MKKAESPLRVHSYRLPTGKSYLALLAKRTYRIVDGKRLEVHAEQEPVRDQQVHVDSTNAGAGPRLLHDSDLGSCAKPLTDVLVRGSAHAPSGASVTTLDVAVQVGRAHKAIRVHGDRVVKLGAGGALSFSEAQSFRSMPLTWDHAYGGRDAHAEARLFRRPSGPFGRARGPGEVHGRLSYPRNAAGRGFAIDLDRERLEGAALPNLEDASDPVTPERLLVADPMAWIDCPAAACFDSIDHLTFPRAAFLICPDANPPSRPLYEIGNGALAAGDLVDTPRHQIPSNPRLYNAAPAGLAVCRLEGGERVSLVNLHPRHARIELDLPASAPKMRIEPQGAGPRELSPLLQTVLIEPDQERVTLTWAGVLEVGLRYPDELIETMPHAAVFAE